MLGQMSESWTFENLSSHPDVKLAPETGTTFEENAAIKAVSASHQIKGSPILADDSGIEVDALGGAPGVWSARFAGEGADDAANRTKLLQELENVTDSGSRSARFCCVMVVAQDGEVIATVRGEVEGTLTMEERGDGGFGYDPIFIPEGHEETFAELSADVKNSISHRARALLQIAERLDTL